MQVMLMITSGMNVQEISDRLFLSTKTINGYRYRTFEKLGIKNDVELTYLALKHGIIENPIDLASEDWQYYWVQNGFVRMCSLGAAKRNLGYIYVVVQG